jgi:adenylyltransferase/sulfurtransferase
MKPEIYERYSRQILFKGIGTQGQDRLLHSAVAVVGCGATGSALVSLLARAGIGMLRIIDRDYVELSNLQRQSLFDESDAAESLPKATAACRKIASFNSQIAVEAKVADLRAENSEELLAGVDLILDGTDNFETRYLINDYAVKHSLPWIYCAAVGSYVTTMNIVPGETACLSCLFPESPAGIVETCETSGILNSAANLVAATAVTEALKLLCGAKEQLRRALIS